MKAMNDPTARAGQEQVHATTLQALIRSGDDMMLVIYVSALSLYLPSLMQP
jgi:hypothetical protein